MKTIHFQFFMTMVFLQVSLQGCLTQKPIFTLDETGSSQSQQDDSLLLPLSNVTASSDSSTDILLTWDLPNAATKKVVVAFATHPAQPQCDQAQVTIPATQNQYMISGLQPATVTNVALCTQNDSGLNSSSVTASQSTLPLPPTPASFMVSINSSTQVTAQWSSGGGRTEGFSLAYAAQPLIPVCQSNAIVTSASATTQIIQGLTANVTYNFVICASAGTRKKDFSLPIAISATTNILLPPNPTQVTTTALSQTQIRVNWTSGGGTTTGFFFHHVLSPQNPSCTSANAVSLNANVSMRTVTGLTPGATYRFIICSRNSSNPPGISSGVLVTGTTAEPMVLSTSSSSIAANQRYTLVSQVISTKCAGCHLPMQSYNEQDYYNPRPAPNTAPLVRAGILEQSPFWTSLTGNGGDMPRSQPALAPLEMGQVRGWVLGRLHQLSSQVSGGVAPYTYSWSPSSGLSSSTIANPLASPLSTTTYTLTVTDAVNVSINSTITIQVIAPLSVNLGPDRAIPPGGSTQFSPLVSGGVSPYTYLWSPPTGLSSTTIANPTAMPAQATTYTLTVTDNVGSQASDSIQVNIGSAGTDFYQSSTITQTRVANRKAYKSFLDKIFNAPAKTKQWIIDQANSFAGPCDVHKFTTSAETENAECAALINPNDAESTEFNLDHTYLPLTPGTTTAREAFRYRVCMEMLESNTAGNATVAYAAQQAGAPAGVTTTRRPTDAELTAIFALFHPGKAMPAALTTSLQNLRQGAADNLESWRMIFLVSCLESSHQIL